MEFLTKGTIKLINDKLSKKINLHIGDVVYFDPKMMLEVKDFELVVVNYKSIILKESK